MAIPTDSELIRIALERSGVARDAAADAGFYSKANKAGALNYRDIRKFGTPVTAEEKADRGLRYRGVMTREFLATLNEAGLADPARAAELIATPMSGMLSTAKGLRNAYRSGIRQFIFRAGHMATGSCEKALAMDRKRFSGDQVQPAPLVECTSRDQCGCRWQSTIA